MNTRYRIGQLLLALAIAATPGFQVTADWSGTDHIFNPEWPGHAKYHLIVYHLTLILFSAAALYGCFQPKWIHLSTLPLALFSLIAFWVPYYVADAFPMATAYASSRLAENPIPVQFIVGAALIIVGCFGWALTRPIAAEKT